MRVHDGMRLAPPVSTSRRLTRQGHVCGAATPEGDGSLGTRHLHRRLSVGRRRRLHSLEQPLRRIDDRNENARDVPVRGFSFSTVVSCEGNTAAQMLQASLDSEDAAPRDLHS